MSSSMSRSAGAILGSSDEEDDTVTDSQSSATDNENDDDEEDSSRTTATSDDGHADQSAFGDDKEVNSREKAKATTTANATNVSTNATLPQQAQAQASKSPRSNYSLQQDPQSNKDHDKNNDIKNKSSKDRERERESSTVTERGGYTSSSPSPSPVKNKPSKDKKQSTTSITPKSIHFELHSGGHDSDAENGANATSAAAATEDEDTLLAQYRKALLEERAQRLLLQDLCLRQKKRLEKVKHEAKTKHEALLEVAIRNMSLEEELDRARNGAASIVASNTPQQQHQEQQADASSSKKPQLNLMKMLRLNKSSSNSATSSASSAPSSTLPSPSASGGHGSGSGGGGGGGVIMDDQTSPDTASLSSNFIGGGHYGDNRVVDDDESVRTDTGGGMGGLSMFMSSFKDKKGQSQSKWGKNQQQKSQQQQSAQQQQLQEEVVRLEKQLNELRMKEQETNLRMQANDEIVSYLKSQHKVTRDLLEGTKTRLSKSMRQCKVLNRERLRLMKEMEQLRSQSSEDKIKLEKWQELLTMTTAEAKKLKEETIPSLQKQVEALKEETKAKDEIIAQFGEKLFHLKTQLNNVRLQLRKFSVNRCLKTKKPTKTEATIVLHKNPMNKLFMIDIMEGKNQTMLYSYPLTMITDVQLLEHQNQFSIKFLNENLEWFEATNCADIVDDIREFIDLASAVRDSPQGPVKP